MQNRSPWKPLAGMMFARALADPHNPQIINPIYDGGDHLHPNDAGYKVMADTVTLALLLRPLS